MNVTKTLKSAVSTAVAAVMMVMSSTVALPPANVATAASGNPLENVIAACDNSLPGDFIARVDKVAKYEDTQIKNKSLGNLTLSRVVSNTGSMSGIATSVNQDSSRTLTFRIAGDNIKLVWNVSKSYGSYVEGSYDVTTPLGDFSVKIDDSVIHYYVGDKDIEGASIKDLEKNYRGSRYISDTYIVSEGSSLANPYEIALCSSLYYSIKNYDYKSAQAEQERLNTPLTENELTTLSGKFGSYANGKTAINPSSVSSAISKLASSTDIRGITAVDALNGVGGNGIYKFKAEKLSDGTYNYTLDGGKSKNLVSFKIESNGEGIFSTSDITMNGFYTDGRQFSVLLNLGFSDNGEKVINAKFISGERVVEKQYSIDSKFTQNNYYVSAVTGDDAKIDCATVSAIARLLVWSENNYTS